MEGARKAEGEFSELPVSLQHPAIRPLQKLQKGSFFLGLSPIVGIKRASQQVVFEISPGYHTIANGHHFVELSKEKTKGKRLL